MIPRSSTGSHEEKNALCVEFHNLNICTRSLTSHKLGTDEEEQPDDEQPSVYSPEVCVYGPLSGQSTSVYGPLSGQGGLDAGQPSGGAKRRRSANFEKLLRNFEAGPDTRMVQVANPEESRVKVVEATARVKVWDKKDDEKVRRLAARNVGRRWSLMKLCGSVVDEMSGIVDELPLKDKLKEKLWWKGEERKKFTEWKHRNIKFLNLKESERKDVAKVEGPLGNYLKSSDKKKFEVKKC